MQQTTKTIPSRCSTDTEGLEKPSPSTTENGSSKVASVAQGLGEGKSINFEKCLSFLDQKGKAQFGQHFTINPADYEIIYKLLVYAFKHEPSAKKYNINLQKGILLSGPVGCGKTTLMYLINHFQSEKFRHIMKPSREVGYEFIKDGYETIHKYSTNAFNKKGVETWHRTYCFDDLGTENNLKYYGNECNVMAEILLSRYELFVHNHMITHITTNLSATEIETCYGNRVRSRMREMFNLISFTQTTKDKR